MADERRGPPSTAVAEALGAFVGQLAGWLIAFFMVRYAWHLGMLATGLAVVAGVVAVFFCMIVVSIGCGGVFAWMTRGRD
jgi:hypothetical protein